MEENETIVERFLAENSNFKICQMSMLGSPKEDSDSMFVAVLVKS
jgi:16S rRNA C967 or C1407 C5-methylase (RsmB/RsmF family)